MTHEYECELDIVVNDEDIPLVITYVAYGKHLPATWGYDGGSPEEFPEIHIKDISHADNPDKKFDVKDVFNDARDPNLEAREGLPDLDEWIQEMTEKVLEPDDDEYW